MIFHRRPAFPDGGQACVWPPGFSRSPRQSGRRFPFLHLPVWGLFGSNVGHIFLHFSLLGKLFCIFNPTLAVFMIRFRRCQADYPSPKKFFRLFQSHLCCKLRLKFSHFAVIATVFWLLFCLPTFSENRFKIGCLQLMESNSGRNDIF